MQPTTTTGTRRGQTALVVLAATHFLLILDSAIVNVALATIGRDLQMSPAGLTWVVNAYVLVFGGLLMLGGRLCDVVGPRRLFLGGAATFVLASAAAALAPSAGWLVGARAAQGVGAALAAPTLLALAMRMFPAGPERTRVLGLMASMAGAGGASGLVLGGLLTSAYGWPAIFWVNVPVGVAVLAVAAVSLPADDRGGRGRIDVAGAVVATAGVTALVYLLVEAPETGWLSARTLWLAAASTALLGGFVAIERRVPIPLLPLGFLRSRRTSAGLLVIALTATGLFPMWFVLALHGQQQRGYGPLATGLSILPVVVMFVTMNSRASALLRRFPVRLLVSSGLALAALGLTWLWLAPTGGHYVAALLPPMVVTGLGFGLSFVAAIVGATSHVPEDLSGLASGLLNVGQQIGGALGLAAVATALAGPDVRDGFLGCALLTAVAALAALVLIPRQPTTKTGEL